MLRQRTRRDDATGPPEVIALIDPTEQLGQVIEEWRALSARIPRSSYFQTPDWVLSWWEDRGRPPTEIAIWRDDDGQLEAVAFLSRVRERLHRRLPISVGLATNLGSGRPHSADRCGWPVLPHRTADVQRWAANHHWRKSLLLRHLDRESGVPSVPQGARLVLTTRCPALALPEDLSEPPRARKLQKQVPYFRRRLERMGVSFTWTPPERMTTEAIDLLFSLHESRRTLKDGSSFSREAAADFHRRLVVAGGPNRGPAMVVAHHEGRPVGINYGLLWGEVYFFYQGGWDASYAKLNLGTVLTAEALRLTQANGIRCFEFLRGVEPYKYRFGATDVVDETWLLPRGVGGWLLARKLQLARRQQRRDLRAAGAP
jgi:CelD/BcsL family acetyltransferase involved in cellulose biosynthesis